MITSTLQTTRLALGPATPDHAEASVAFCATLIDLQTAPSTGAAQKLGAVLKAPHPRDDGHQIGAGGILGGGHDCA